MIPLGCFRFLGFLQPHMGRLSAPGFAWHLVILQAKILQLSADPGQESIKPIMPGAFEFLPAFRASRFLPVGFPEQCGQVLEEEGLFFLG